MVSPHEVTRVAPVSWLPRSLDPPHWGPSLLEGAHSGETSPPKQQHLGSSPLCPPRSKPSTLIPRPAASGSLSPRSLLCLPGHLSAHPPDCTLGPSNTASRPRMLASRSAQDNRTRSCSTGQERETDTLRDHKSSSPSIPSVLCSDATFSKSLSHPYFLAFS